MSAINSQRAAFDAWWTSKAYSTYTSAYQAAFEAWEAAKSNGPAERDAVLEEAATRLDKCAAVTRDKMWESAAEQVRALKRSSATELSEP